MAKEQNRSCGRSGEGSSAAVSCYWDGVTSISTNSVAMTSAMTSTAQRMRRVMARPGATGTSNRGRTTAVKLGA